MLMVVSHEGSRRSRDASGGKVDQLFDVRTSSANTIAKTIRLRESSLLILSITMSASCSAEGACEGAHSRPVVITARIVRTAIVHARPLRRVLKRRCGRGVACDDGVLYREGPTASPLFGDGRWISTRIAAVSAHSAAVLVLRGKA